MKEPLFRVLIAAMAFLLIIAGCTQQDPSAPEETNAVPQNGFSSRLSKTSDGEELPITSDELDAVNLMLEQQGKQYRIAYAEYLTAGESNEVGPGRQRYQWQRLHERGQQRRHRGRFSHSHCHDYAVDDSIYEGNETAVLTLSASASYVIGSPGRVGTVTITENDPVPPQYRLAGGNGCFIATAAYGTPMAEQVRYLRAFRDQYLQTNEAGRWFVSQYYQYCPLFADYLRQHDDLRTLVRTALSPLVGLSRAVVSEYALAVQTADRP